MSGDGWWAVSEPSVEGPCPDPAAHLRTAPERVAAYTRAIMAKLPHVWAHMNYLSWVYQAGIRIAPGTIDVARAGLREVGRRRLEMLAMFCTTTWAIRFLDGERDLLSLAEEASRDAGLPYEPCDGWPAEERTLADGKAFMRAEGWLMANGWPPDQAWGA